MNFDWVSFPVTAPLLTLAAGALVILVLDLILDGPTAQDLWYIAAGGAVLTAAYYLITIWNINFSAFNQTLIMDQMALIFGLIILGATGLTILLAMGRGEEDKGGYLSLILWAACGMIVMVAASNMIALFLGLELLSLSLYVAVAFDPARPQAREAALKYFILGSAASGFVLFGFAFIYGATGSMTYSFIQQSLSDSLFLKVGIALTLVGFGFKLALVPFHAWAPDVYQGAPTPTTAFMSVGTKAAAFVMLVRFLAATVPVAKQAVYLWPLALLAALSMLVGSAVGIWQKDLKRLMAYSSIVNAGYLLMAVPGLSPVGNSAAAFYLAAYGCTTIGVFAVVALLESEGRNGADIEALTGLYYRRPAMALTLTALMFGLIGLPPAGGFVGKLLLAKAAWAALGTAPTSTWTLLIALMLSTGISAYVYLRVVGVLFRKPVGEAKLAPFPAPGPLMLSGKAVRRGLLVAMAVSTGVMLLMGVWPAPFMRVLTIVLPQ